MEFENLLIQAINKIDGYMSLFIEIEDNPERILTDVFSGQSDNLLTRIFESSEELTGELLEVHDLQDYLYENLIPFLNTHIQGDYLYRYDADQYPSPIQIFEGDREIGRLNIFERKFIIIPHEDVRKEIRHLAQLEAELNRCNQEILKFEEYQKNPLAYGETPLKKVEVAIRKKHFEKEIKNKYEELIATSMDLEQKIISQRLLVEKIQEELQPYENMKYSIAYFFRDNYGYEIESGEEN